MEENITEVKDKNLVLIEANNEVSKPDKGYTRYFRTGTASF